MSLKILYIDEMRGFYKSKLMIVLWIGMPLISFLMQFMQPDLEGIPITYFVAILASSIGGTLSSVMLSTSITSERNRNVYELFLIRPVNRRTLLLSKYFAVLTCLVIATVISLLIGIIVDYVNLGTSPIDLLENNMESLVISLAGMSISCATGILFGSVVKSVPVAAILSVYLGNQISSIIILPTIFIASINPIIYSLIIGVSITVLILIISILIFNRKQF